MLVNEISKQIVDAADLEASIVLDLREPGLDEQLAAELHQRIRWSFLQWARDGPPSVDRKAATRYIKKVLSSLINEATDIELTCANKAFFEAVSSNVEYVYREADAGEDAIVVDSSQLPFVDCHGNAISAAQRIRLLPSKIQLAALAGCQSLEKALYTRMGAFNDSQDEQRNEYSKGVSEAWRTELDEPSVSDVEAFFFAMARGGATGIGVPIAVSPTVKSDVLARVASAYWGFGSELRLIGAPKVQGKKMERLRVEAAWAEYASRGLCFKILASWIRAFPTEMSHGLCSICYRHTATSKRCGTHSTSTHETREGRLGKLVHPQYLRRMGQLLRQPTVKTSLGSSFSPWREVDTTIEAAVQRMSIPPHISKRAAVLASQLNSMEELFELQQSREDATKLFAEIVRVASENALPRDGLKRAYYSLEEASQRLRRSDRATELLSLREFFRLWFGKFPDRVFGAELRPRGYDPKHPVIAGFFDTHSLPTHLLRQRSWEEAFAEFANSVMPTRDTILSHLVTKTVRQTASDLKIAVRTLYKYLNGNGKERPRNRLQVVRHRR